MVINNLGNDKQVKTKFHNGEKVIDIKIITADRIQVRCNKLCRKRCKQKKKETV